MKKLYVDKYLLLLGLDKTSLRDGTGMSWTTLGKLFPDENDQSAKTPKPTTLKKVAKFLSEHAGREITIFDLYRDAFDVLERQPQAVVRSEVQDCIDLDSLAANPDVRLDGQPLSEEARKVYEYMLDAIRKANKKE